jgi:hypothetical protein
MSTGADAYRPISQVDASFEASNKRRYPRYELSLSGRFMRADKLDYPCQLIDISVESAAITTPIQLRVGEKLIVYLQHLGGLEGTVVRLFPASFAMMISGTQRKRDKLALQIPRLATHSELPESEERQYPRMTQDETAVLGLQDGTATPCQLHDLSLSGAALVTPARPPLGSEVTVDKRRAVVVRHHERGIAVKFVNQGSMPEGTSGAGLRAQPYR